MSVDALDNMIKYLAKLPGLGPRSARRAALYLLERQDKLLLPLAESLNDAARNVKSCGRCGNYDSIDPCHICSNPARDHGLLCVVEQVADLWALERSGVWQGGYHVLGGVMSALDGVGPDDLRIASLIQRARGEQMREIVMALSATVDGQATAYFIADKLAGTGVAISRLAHGVPVGGELDYLDDGTLSAAMKARRVMGAG